jgi:hypothetical protein
MLREADKDRTIRLLNAALFAQDAEERAELRMAKEQQYELEEAMHMGGSGPWRSPSRMDDGQSTSAELRESTLPYIAQGAYGDAELMLQNVQWKRETALSWLEFTRWGIQQIILICRLRCLKDPMLLRGVNLSAQYTFGRDVDITSEDQTANDILKDWRERNKKVLGHVALTDQHKAKFYDGNLFWICFTDAQDSGNINLRTFDAVEIMDILCNPEDSSEPWYYKREWVQQNIAADGSRENVTVRRWYPALNFEPTGKDKFDEIEGVPVEWGTEVYHRKCGAPGKWHFGLPLVYAALGYAQSVKRFLEDCMTIRNSLAQFSMLLTTKGGQQALQGAKTQLSTTVGPNASLWDQNPPAVAGAVFAIGPGTELSAFSTKGAGGDPGEVREYKLMVQMVFGFPESFFSDMSATSLATATSLDRTTLLNITDQQAIWQEDLAVLAQAQLKASLGAPSGRLRESASKSVRICERAKVRNKRGVLVYEAKPKDGEITVMVNFPSVIEADIPENIAAIVNAATFGNKAGEFVGIDEKEAVRLCNQELDIPEEVLAEQYPDSGPNAYDPVRKPAPEPVIDPATGQPVPAGPAPGEAKPVKQAEALRGAMKRLASAMKIWEAEHGGMASE